MGRLEESIVASLEALCGDEPGCGRHMFVLPAREIEATGFLRLGVRVERAGEVVMMCRDGPEPL